MGGTAAEGHLLLPWAQRRGRGVRLRAQGQPRLCRVCGLWRVRAWPLHRSWGWAELLCGPGSAGRWQGKGRQGCSWRAWPLPPAPLGRVGCRAASTGAGEAISKNSEVCELVIAQRGAARLQSSVSRQDAGLPARCLAHTARAYAPRTGPRLPETGGLPAPRPPPLPQGGLSWAPLSDLPRGGGQP